MNSIVNRLAYPQQMPLKKAVPEGTKHKRQQTTVVLPSQKPRPVGQSIDKKLLVEPQVPKAKKEAKKVQFDVSLTSNTEETPLKEETPEQEESEVELSDMLQSFRLSPRDQAKQDQTPERIVTGGGKIVNDQDEAQPFHYNSQELLARANIQTQQQQQEEQKGGDGDSNIQAALASIIQQESNEDVGSNVNASASNNN